MKRKYPSASAREGWSFSVALALAASFAPLCALPSLLCARPALASPELDRLYALETIGFLKAWDNVDGLFADYVTAAYKDYFANQSRFVVNDLSKADSVFSSSKLPYNQVIDDADLLTQLSRVTRTESLIRTKIVKEGPQYRFTLEWLHSPKIELLASETITLEEPRDGKAFGLGDIKAALHKALDSMVKKVPFQGHVTGRDETSVTVNIGELANVRVGDTMVLATVEEAKKHPLLKAVVDWRTASTGRIEIEEVDGGISFGKILEEEPGRKISRYQKVVQVIPRSQTARDKPEVIDEQKIKLEETKRETPHLGYITASLGVGSFGRDLSIEATSANGLDEDVLNTGGGLFTAGRGEGEIWFNKEFFANAGFTYGFWNHTQEGTQEGADAAGTMLSLKGTVGYTYLATEDYFGPKGWVKLGYRMTNYTLPYDAPRSIGASKFNAVIAGVGGELPIRDAFGAMLSLELGLLPSLEEINWETGIAKSITDFSISFGGYMNLTPKMRIKAGFDVISNSADFDNGSTLTHRIITFSPALLFYF